MCPPPAINHKVWDIRFGLTRSALRETAQVLMQNGRQGCDMESKCLSCSKLEKRFVAPNLHGEKGAFEQPSIHGMSNLVLKSKLGPANQTGRALRI